MHSLGQHRVQSREFPPYSFEGKTTQGNAV